ncbi:hypothetical protein DFH07DRAFT_763625 [Mycena maculata]|uniref:Uncharacterized protein n=1 Tax=Mycena maculata TaxID=230809 RepID=A0AAD7P2G6_9AGAR|nr:hypothetical protein DFH07DRAFT_763625 [Mycena maculata]
MLTIDGAKCGSNEQVRPAGVEVYFLCRLWSLVPSAAPLMSFELVENSGMGSICPKMASKIKGETGWITVSTESRDIECCSVTSAYGNWTFCRSMQRQSSGSQNGIDKKYYCENELVNSQVVKALIQVQCGDWNPKYSIRKPQDKAEDADWMLNATRSNADCARAQSEGGEAMFTKTPAASSQPVKNWSTLFSLLERPQFTNQKANGEFVVITSESHVEYESDIFGLQNGLFRAWAWIWV